MGMEGKRQGKRKIEQGWVEPAVGYNTDWGEGRARIS